jgi:hypothetical protein
MILSLAAAAGCSDVQPTAPDAARPTDAKNLVTVLNYPGKLDITNLSGRGLNPFAKDDRTPLRMSLEGGAPGSVAKAMVAGDTPSLIWYATDGTATLCRMTGTVFTGQCSTVLNIPSPWQMVSAGDMNGDGHPDLIWEATDGTHAVTFMNGPAYALSYTMMFQIPSEWRTVATADFNGDAKTDIVVENTSTGEHIVLYMNGAVFAGTAANLPTTALNQKLAAVGDVNGDGKPDLIWQNTSTGARLVTYLNGITPTGAAVTMGTLSTVWSIGGAGDYNGDGKADLIISNSTDGQRRIQYVSSSGTIDSLQFVQLPTIPTNWKVVSTAPINWAPSNVQQTGDVAWLRAAITNAPANSTVNIPAGTYDIGSTSIKIMDKNNVQILGAGVGQTIIRGNGSAHMILELENSNVNLTVAHLSIRGGGSSMDNPTHGLASGTNHLNLYGARFFDLDIRDVSVGISVVGNGTGYCNDVQITGNYLENIQDFFTSPGVTSGSGYGIHNEGCTSLRIADNTLKNVDRHGIYQALAYQPDRTGPGSIVIEHNLIIDQARTASIDARWLVAISVARSSNVVIANNVIVNAYHDAISVENPPEANTYIVNNVRVIGNTVLGSRGADIFLTASGNFTFWGNKFFHSDATGDPSVPFIYKDGYAFYNGANMVEPSAYAGTQSLVTPSPFSTTYVMQNNLLQSAVVTYNADPSTWSRHTSTIPWTSFESMTASPTMIYAVNNRKVVEVNPVTEVPRLSPTIFTAKSEIAYADGAVIVANGTQLFRVDLSTLASTGSPAPGTGPIRGMVGWGTKIYLMSGSCYYEVVPSTLAATQIGC